MTTFPPSAANRWAIALPMPLAAPVMIATLSFKRINAHFAHRHENVNDDRKRPGRHNGSATARKLARARRGGSYGFTFASGSGTSLMWTAPARFAISPSLALWGRANPRPAGWWRTLCILLSWIL